MTDFIQQNIGILSRLRHMLSGWGGVGLVYFSTGFLQGQGVVLPETALDRMVPYNPIGIWLYLSFFILIPYTYFTVDADRVRWLTRAMLVCAAFCGLIFVSFPTTLDYSSVTVDSISGEVVHLLMSADSSQNCLPSLHGALTLLCVWALWDIRYRRRSILAVLLGLGICYAVIQLRRHVSIDLTAGLLAGLICGWICKRQPLFLRRNREMLF